MVASVIRIRSDRVADRPLLDRRRASTRRGRGVGGWDAEEGNRGTDRGGGGGRDVRSQDANRTPKLD